MEDNFPYARELILNNDRATPNFSISASARLVIGKRKRSQGGRGGGSHECGNDKQENPPLFHRHRRHPHRRRRSSPVFSPFPVLCSREPPRLHNPLRQSSHRSLARPRTPWSTSSGPTSAATTTRVEKVFRFSSCRVALSLHPPSRRFFSFWPTLSFSLSLLNN